MNLKRLLVMMTVMLAMFSLSAVAQNKTVSGKVTNATNGSPLVKATVSVEGTKIATATSSDGTFTLAVPPTAKNLVISYIGFDNQVVPISGGNVSVSMKQSIITGGDVVVIGYGSVKKKDLTGSVATVTAKDFQQGAITTPEGLIAGKVAGVSITSNGGSPGSGSVIRIHGGASLNASNDPLIVIDGVPITGGISSTGSENQLAGTPNGGASILSLVNPDDIESFTVLKDAAATAIYGSRASNGVILIVTKHGGRGKAKIGFSTQLGDGILPKEYPVLSAGQFRNLVNTSPYATTAQQALMGTANTDWQKQIFQNALNTDNNLTLSGSIKNLPYRINGEYMDQEGILKTDNLQRFAVGLNLNPTLFDNHLKIDISLHGTISNTRFANGGAIGSAITFDPTQPVKVPGSYFGGYYEWLGVNDTTLNTLANRNPVALLQQYNNTSQVKRSFGNIKFDYKLHFLPDLHFNLNLGYDVAKGAGATLVPVNAAQSYNNGNPLLRGANNPYASNYTNKTLEFYLSYNKDIKSIKSNINAIAGYGYYDNFTDNYNYPSFGASRMDTIPGTQPNYPVTPVDVTLISYYSRLIYTFDSKYILMGSIRTDGSSRFGPFSSATKIGSPNKWGIFPSAAFTWKVNQENFLKDSRTLSQLNIRASYGVTGNQDGIPPYSYIPTYFLSQPGSLYPFGSTFYQMITPNAYVENLKWESTTTKDVGIDYGFLNNRINGSVDYYYKTTTNLLANTSVPAGSNFANSLYTNVGSMNDKGLDFNINYQPIRTKDLTWDVGFNASYNQFTITSLTLYPNPSFVGLPIGSINGATGQTIQIDKVGYAPNSFYVYQQVYSGNGEPYSYSPYQNTYNTPSKPIEGLYVDQNRDGVINQKDLMVDHSPNPKWILGFSTALNYKKWNISTVLRSNIGNYVYNNTASNDAVIRNVLNPANFLQNAPSSVLFTNFYQNQYQSSYYIENASFLRMDNLGVAYNFGAISKSFVNNLRVSFNCQNVFVITKYTGMDPEIPSGIDNNFYPHPRTFTLGLNLSL